MTEWRVRVPGTGPWASGSWNFPFATEDEARTFAQENGGEAYLQDYGESRGRPRVKCEPDDLFAGLEAECSRLDG
jgi:hypothetical protein